MRLKITLNMFMKQRWERIMGGKYLRLKRNYFLRNYNMMKVFGRKKKLSKIINAGL